MADEVLAALLRVVVRGYAPGQELLPLQLAPEAVQVLFEDWWQHCWADVQLVLRFAEQQGSKGGSAVLMGLAIHLCAELAAIGRDGRHGWVCNMFCELTAHCLPCPLPNRRRAADRARSAGPAPAALAAAQQAGQAPARGRALKGRCCQQAQPQCRC
jgi:hypothetical protein